MIRNTREKPNKLLPRDIFCMTIPTRTLSYKDKDNTWMLSHTRQKLLNKKNVFHPTLCDDRELVKQIMS